MTTAQQSMRTPERTTETVFTPLSPLLLTVAAAAKELSVGRDKVFALIRTGELRSVKVGHSRRIPRRELEAYVDRLTGDETASTEPWPLAPARKGAPSRGTTRP